MQVQDRRKLPRGSACRSAVGRYGEGKETDDDGTPERKGKMDQWETHAERQSRKGLLNVGLFTNSLTK